MHLWLVLILIQSAICLFPGAVPDEGDVRHIYPIVTIALGLKDHAHVLPYILGWLENIEYPKQRLRLEIYVNGKEDATEDQILWWKDSVKELFLSLKVTNDKEDWMEDGLRSGRMRKSSAVFIVSGDVVLRNEYILKTLSTNSTEIVICPVIHPFLDEQPWNVPEISDELKNVANKGRVTLNQATLPLYVKLDNIDSSYLTFDNNNLHGYDGPTDFLEVFYHSATKMNIDVWAENSKYFGFYIDENLDHSTQTKAIRYHLADLAASSLAQPLYSRTVRPWTPEPELFGMDKIYLINLKRRTERLKKMQKIFSVLAIDYTLLEATDGHNLPQSVTFQQLPGYLDPFHKRPMKTGEIGCFMSHYRIWQEVVTNNLKQVIVFEDDLRFSLGGMERINEALEDIKASKLEWDLIYLGRKKQADQEELWVPEHRHLSTVGYSYWTLGYIISQSGAKKLLNAKPLDKLVPVDEYLPIMFDKHPNKEWSSHFPQRDLVAYTLYPLVVSPQLYVKDAGYTSDTEQSEIISDRQMTGQQKDEL